MAGRYSETKKKSNDIGSVRKRNKKRVRMAILWLLDR